MLHNIDNIYLERGFILDYILLFFSKELVKLVDDYYRCNDEIIKDQIQDDIMLLTNALMLCETP